MSGGLVLRLRLFTLPNCPRCPAAKAVAGEVASGRSDVVLEVLDMGVSENMFTALMLQIASTPSFAIEDTPIFLDGVPSASELNRLIDEYKQKHPDKQ